MATSVSQHLRPVLVVLAAAFTTACHCDRTRSSTFTGHLGDSTTAVGIFTTAPGGMDFFLDEYSGDSYQSRTVRLKVNTETFVDSVWVVRLSDFTDPNRTTIVEFNKAKGVRSGSLFEARVDVDAADFPTVWDVFSVGDGIVEIEPHVGQPVRARLKPLAVGGWGRYCP